MEFAHSALLYGTLLFSVPLIIHLLNRRRFKRRRWAAMEFLLSAYKKHRRRLRTENLLLLLLRCLIPIILALAISRPLLQHVSGLPTTGPSHHVIVLDQSYSMGYHPDGGRSPFERAKVLCGEILADLQGGTAHKVSIWGLGTRPRKLCQEDVNLDRAKALIKSLPGPEDSAADLTAGLVQVAESLESTPRQETRVYLFTDLQARSFGPDVAAEKAPGAVGPVRRTPPEAAVNAGEKGAGPEAFADTAADALERIQKRASLTVLDVGTRGADGGSNANLQIESLALGRPHAVRRVPVPVVVSLINHTDTQRLVQVELEIEDAGKTRKEVTLAAGSQGQVSFLVTFREIGPRHLAARIEPDGLPVDDARFLVVQVRERLRLLLVEGSAETDPSLMESEHLRSILDPSRGEGPPELTVFAPKIIDTVQFLSLRENLQDYDLVALCNIDRLNAAAATALEDAMRGGTGLLVMLGSNTDPESFNLHLYSAGEGPMPLRLSGPSGYRPGGRDYYTCEIERPEHPIFADLREDVERTVFEQTPIYRFVATSPPAVSQARTNPRFEVLARLRDPDLSPLLFTSRFGAGKALFLTSAISRRPDRWNRLDWPGVSFPFFHPAVYWLTLPATDPFNVPVGAPLTTTLRHRPTDVAVVLPERAGMSKVLIGEESRRLPGERYTLPTFRDTSVAGLYSIEALLDVEGSKQQLVLPFAVNPDPAEGDLTYLTHSEARERLRVERIVRALPNKGEVTVATGGGDLGVPLLYLVLLLLLGEATLARLVSRRRA